MLLPDDAVLCHCRNWAVLLFSASGVSSGHHRGGAGAGGGTSGDVSVPQAGSLSGFPHTDVQEPGILDAMC